MQRPILAGLVTGATWLLLYVNETSVGRQWVYTFALVCPSVGFWLLIWANKRPSTAHDRSSRSTSVALSMAAIVGLLLGWISFSMIDPSVLTAKPWLFSLITAVYVGGSVTALSSWMGFMSGRHYVLYNRLLGPLAAVSMTGFWALRIVTIFRQIHVNLVGFHFMSVWFVATVIVTLLCFLNSRRSQQLAGMGALLGLSLFTASSQVGASLLISIWIDPRYFWPTVIVVTLVVETVIVRSTGLWRRLMSQYEDAPRGDVPLTVQN